MNIQAIDANLADVFGRYSPGWQPADPLAELIETVLNQRTTHVHARKALSNLAACGGWGAVAALPYDTVADLVRPAGLAKQKAARILGILEQIRRDTGAYSLDFLKEMDNRAAAKYLCSLPGAGAHTAALVLLFALGRHGVMPVESHVHRVARRLGWAEHDATPGAVQRAIEGAAPQENLMDLHVNLIRLGHRHCGAGTPDCRECPVSDLCAMGLRQAWW